MAAQQNQDVNQLLKVRHEKLQELQEKGKDPFQITKYDVSRHSQEIKDNFDALEGQEAMTQKKICTYTGLAKQTVNSVIRSLKEKGYIELVPGLADGREKQVVLTEKGIAYSSGILTPLRELEHRVYQIMGSGQVQQMVDQITLFNTVLEKEMEKDM